MELPTQLTDIMFFLLVCLLAIMPLMSGYGVYKIGQVYFRDTARPRNRIIGRMINSGIAIVLSGSFISVLCVAYIVDALQGKARDADFGGVLFVIALLAVGVQPYLNWRNLVRLGRHTSKTRWGREETKNEKEDRQFGEHRRNLEAEHIAEGVDNQTPPVLK